MLYYQKSVCNNQYRVISYTSMSANGKGSRTGDSRASMIDVRRPMAFRSGVDRTSAGG